MIIMIVPSFYLAYNLYDEKKFVKTAEDFITTEFGNKGYTLIYKKLNYQSIPKTIDIAFLTKKFTPAEIEQFNKKLLAAGLTGTKLNIKQNGLNLQSEMMDDPRASKNEVGEKDIIISSLSSEISRYKVEDATLMQEMKILFPELETVSVAKTQQLVKADSTASQIILVYTAEKSVDTEKLRNWLSARLGENNTVIVAEQQ